MLDSSPLPIPPPKKLKRTASVASLPSPPPSVDHLKKRTTAQRFTSSDSDSDLGSDEEEEEVKQDKKFLGRKLLFPAKSLASNDKNDPENPFLDNPKPSNAREQLACDAARSPSASRATAPVSPPPSRRRTSKPSVVSPKTPPPVGSRGRCAASELPVLDKDNNPFLSDSPPRPRRPRSPSEMAEPEMMTYLFKGVKTFFPNPNYNLPDSAFENSRLPLDHPEYSPPPTRAPRRLFPEAYPTVDGAGDEDGDAASHINSNEADTELQTPDTKRRMSKLFVDAAGNPLPDSGPQGVRGKTMDASDIGRMAVGPIRGRG